MPHLENLTTLILQLSIVVVCIDLSFVVYVLYRRVARNRFYRTKDAAGELLAAPVSQFLSGHCGIEQTRAELRPFRAPAARAALQELLLRGLTPANHDGVSQLLDDMGYVQAWARAAFGRRRARQLAEAQRQNRLPEPDSRRRPFPGWLLRTRALAVRRAVAVGHLRRLSPKRAMPYLVEALHDPSPLPRRTAIAALGRLHEPAGIPFLVRELDKSVAETNDVSLRLVKAALTRFPASELASFVPLLEDANPRVRFLAIDIVREICAAHPEQGRVFACAHASVLEKLTADASADVRARTAAVIRYLPIAAAIPVLRRLLEDSNEFVRLHAVRSCADPVFSALSSDLVRRLVDRRWRVREAAVRALAALGDAGTSQLISVFLSTPDRYASEQLSDYMQRSGALQAIVRRLAESDASHADAVCRKMISLGHRSLLQHYASNEMSPEIRARLNSMLAEAVVATQAQPAPGAAERGTGAATGGN